MSTASSVSERKSKWVIWHTYDEEVNFTSIANRSWVYQSFPVVMTQPNRDCFFEGMEYVYHTLRREKTEEQLSEIYHLLFQPSPPVQNLLDHTMKQLGLVPKQYIGLHLRARYPDYVVTLEFSPAGGNGNQTFGVVKDDKGDRMLLVDPRGLAVDLMGIQVTIS